MTKNILKKLPPEKKFRLIGEVITLMSQSELHSSYVISDLAYCFLIPIDLNQFRIYYNDKKLPIGFVCWAFLTEEKKEKYLNGEYTIQPNDWNEGNELIFTEFIAPFNHSKKIIKDLTDNIFPDKIGYSVKVSEKGKIDSVKKFRGRALREKQ